MVEFSPATQEARGSIPSPCSHRVPFGLPGGSAGKESARNAGDLGSSPGLGRSPGEGKGYHSSILAWRSPWTIYSLGLPRVGQD